MTWTNALHYSGQTLAVLAGFALLIRLLRIRDAHLRMRLLQFALLLCLALPFAQPRVRISSFTTADATSAATTAAGNGIQLRIPATTVWTIGASLLLLRLITGYLSLRRLARRATHFETRDGVAIRTSPSISSPVAFGLLRPTVLLPEHALTLPAEIREPMIAHELAHIARRDWAGVLFEELARAALWFHPVVWWTIARIRADREESVDASIAASVGPELYLESLLTAASWQANRNIPFPAPAMLRGGASALERRLHLIPLVKEIPAMTRLHRAAALSAFTLATFGLVITTSSALPLFAQQQGDEDIVKPTLIKKVAPHYPAAAKESRTQGKVVLSVTVGKDGKVVNVTVKDGDAVLAEAAVEAVKEWEYEPARKKGEPVECVMTVDVNFTLAP